LAAETDQVACLFLGEYYLYNAHLKNNIQQGISVLKKGIYKNNPLAMTSLGEYLIQNKPDENKQGLQYLEKACSLDEKNACYILGMAHYKGLLFQPSKQKAYEYLKKASDLGITNNAILGILETDLEKREADHSFDKYAQELVHLEESQLKLTIQKNLEEDFGNIWQTLHPETKKFFITGLVTYRTLKKLDTNDMNLDFSSVILSFTKALENELHHYVYELYFEYIRENNIKPDDFSSIEKDNFFNKNGKLINIHQEGPNFTLGRIKYIMFTKIEFSRLMNNKINQVTKTLVGDDKLKNEFTFESGLIGNQNRQDQSTIQVTRFNSHFISFIKHLFKEDSFDVEDYDEELEIDMTKPLYEEDEAFRKYVRDSSCYVDISKLKDLKVFPVWLDKIEDAIATNIHNFAAFNANMYNKKLEGMYGALELTAPNRNLIIIDISGSIPKNVSSTCLSLAKKLSNLILHNFSI
jgi:hypothetical protein